MEFDFEQVEFVILILHRFFIDYFQFKIAHYTNQFYKYKFLFDYYKLRILLLSSFYNK